MTAQRKQAFTIYSCYGLHFVIDAFHIYYIFTTHIFFTLIPFITYIAEFQS